MERTDELFSSIWRRQQEAEFEPPPDTRCSYARRFADWAAEVCHDALQRQDLIALNQAKVLLLDKYFEWRAFVPKNHRYRMTETGHICIFHIFEEAYRQIKLAELTLSPPKLIEPPPAPLPALPPPVPQIPPPPLFDDICIDDPE